jgi:ribosomal protein L14E/L6E/L27E
MSARTAIGVLNRVRADLERDVEPAYRKKITELVPTGVTIIGVRVPAIRKIAQAWHHANKDTTPDTALDLLTAAFKRRCREELLFATVIVSRLKKKLTAAHLMRMTP